MTVISDFPSQIVSDTEILANINEFESNYLYLFKLVVTSDSVHRSLESEAL